MGHGRGLAAVMAAVLATAGMGLVAVGAQAAGVPADVSEAVGSTSVSINGRTVGLGPTTRCTNFKGNHYWFEYTGRLPTNTRIEAEATWGHLGIGLADFGSDVAIYKGSYDIIVEFRYRKDRNFDRSFSRAGLDEWSDTSVVSKRTGRTIIPKGSITRAGLTVIYDSISDPPSGNPWDQLQVVDPNGPYAHGWSHSDDRTAWQTCFDDSDTGLASCYILTTVPKSRLSSATRSYIGEYMVGVFNVLYGTGYTLDSVPEYPNAPLPGGAVSRLYNPHTGEHLYTPSVAERDRLVRLGWRSEGVGWTASSSGVLVWRLYNPHAAGGDHMYTADPDEFSDLVRAGWRSDGPMWYSSGETPVYRQYNPYARAGSHNYTTSKAESDHLVSLGWRYEGIAWYGV